MQKRLSLFIPVLVAVISCGGPESSNQPPFGDRRGGGFDRVTSVETATVERSSISRQIRSYGTIRSQDVVSISPQLSERVMRIEADLGDTVSPGQVLARLYDIPYRDQLRRDQAELRQREITMERDSLAFQRQQSLFERNLISASEFDDARAAWLSSVSAYESSLASLTQNRENLDRTAIRSPVHGVITNRFISEGDLAGTGQPIFEIANLTGYEIRLFLPQREWSLTRRGQKVDIRNSGDHDFHSRGIITRKSPDLDATTGLGQVVVSISEAGDELYSGALTESRIIIETRNEVVVIPRSAMIENVQTVIDPESNTIQLERAYAAFVVEGDSLARRRSLELGIEQGDRIEIIGGLQAGEQLIVTGQSGLQDRARIRPTSLQRDQGRTGGGSEHRRQR